MGAQRAATFPPDGDVSGFYALPGLDRYAVCSQSGFRQQCIPMSQALHSQTPRSAGFNSFLGPLGFRVIESFHCWLCLIAQFSYTSINLDYLSHLQLLFPALVWKNCEKGGNVVRGCTKDETLARRRFFTRIMLHQQL